MLILLSACATVECVRIVLMRDIVARAVAQRTRCHCSPARLAPIAAPIKPPKSMPDQAPSATALPTLEPSPT
jgi:hypothetical protein